MALIWSTSSGATGISLCRWTIGCTSKPMTAEPRISTFGICSLGQTNEDRKSTRLNSSHSQISYAVFCLKKKKLVHERAKAADIVITTALIPGRPAPVLLREETVKAMKPGSVVVDMAIEQGGNCPLTEKDKIVVKHGVKLVGLANLPALVAADASALYARNLLNFLNLLVDPKTGELKLNREDEIIAGSLVCINGEVVKKS